MPDRLTFVCGCPRSGTSLAMMILAQCLGQDHMLGTVHRDGPKASDGCTMSSERFKLLGSQVDSKLREMNPKGFYEAVPYSSGGLPDDAPVEDLRGKKFVKIIAYALRNTGYKYVDRVVYMIRDPRSVACSVIRSWGDFKDAHSIMFQAAIQKYVQSHQTAARWAIDGNVRVLIVDYNDLLSDPFRQLLRLQDFIPEGDFSKAGKVIDRRLHRSTPLDLESPMLGEAEEIYRLLKAGDLEAITLTKS